MKDLYVVKQTWIVSAHKTSTSIRTHGNLGLQPIDHVFLRLPSLLLLKVFALDIRLLEHQINGFNDIGKVGEYNATLTILIHGFTSNKDLVNVVVAFSYE